MSEADFLLSEHDIAATNVLPAFEESLARGVSEAEVEAATGWTRAQLETPDAFVSGASTYRHMELMLGKPNYGAFVVAAAKRHTLSSLGVVGLACKTVATIGEAMQCHQRYQHLTNRTASYATEVVEGEFWLRETREDPSLGSQLISEYTLLIALQLLRDGTAKSLPAIRLQSRRAQVPPEQREAVEGFAGTTLELDCPQAAVALDASVLAEPVASADGELAAYFRAVLERASPPAEAKALSRQVALAIRDLLPTGTPSAETVARQLGFGRRTLQRHLADEGAGFGELVESTRKVLARGYLADPTLSLTEIGYLLGYVEQASFFRAFRRWYGTTPAAYRKGERRA